VADLKQRVAEKIDAMRPYLERSGGQIEFVGIEDNIAHIKLWLTRPGPSRLVVSLQLKSGIERALRNDIPELRGVEAVNLPPYAELGWDQPGFVPVELPVAANGGPVTAEAAPKSGAPKA
jgi:Fe-S cluster biogenesis protein NfuA